MCHCSNKVPLKFMCAMFAFLSKASKVPDLPCGLWQAINLNYFKTFQSFWTFYFGCRVGGCQIKYKTFTASSWTWGGLHNQCLAYPKLHNLKPKNVLPNVGFFISTSTGSPTAAGSQQHLWPCCPMSPGELSPAGRDTSELGVTAVQAATGRYQKAEEQRILCTFLNSIRN